MRKCSVNGRPGLICAQDGKAGMPATRVFVLFDGDDSAESSADWFPVASVLPVGMVAGTF